MGKSNKPSKSNGQVEEPPKKGGKKEDPDSLSSSDTDMSSGSLVQSAKGTRAASSGDNAALFALVQKRFKASHELVAGLTTKIEQLELNTTNKFRQVSTQIDGVSSRVDLVEANLGSRIAKLEEGQLGELSMDEASSWPLPSPPGGTSGKQTFKASSSKEGNQPPPCLPFPFLPSPICPLCPSSLE